MSYYLDCLNKGMESSPTDFYQVEGELFMAFYAMKDKPDFVCAFLELSSWMGISARDGVWAYYEYTGHKKVDGIIQYLQENASNSELCKMYALGNHDYDNEKYQDGVDYPEEWMDEAEIIDEWICNNEDDIYAFMQEILRKNSDYFEKLKI